MWKLQGGFGGGMTLLRIVRVHNALKELSEKLKYKHLTDWNLNEYTTEALAEVLNLSRANVSHDLNELVKAGKVFSIKSRPVIFFDKAIIEEKFNVLVMERKLKNMEQLLELISKPENHNHSDHMGDVCLNVNADELIGYSGSLKEQIEQGKSAILYPPNGLHMLLTGSTGVGKTLFAKLLHKMGIECGRFNCQTPFVMFNCADYSNNPQLLMSQLFGHVKGAYTGADKDKVGLIEKADNGILFLDEIHRLPQEGQEMLFSILDDGHFRRLGESESERNVRVLIIGATTEDVGEVLLETYIRRIPVVIKFPNLKDRPLEERESLVKFFFWEESKKIKNEIIVTKEILSIFMLYSCPGNIGQLKSDIQLVCANAYLRYITKQTDEIKVDRRVLTAKMKIAHQNIYAYLAEENNGQSLVNVTGEWTTADYSKDNDQSILSTEQDINGGGIEICCMDSVHAVFERIFDLKSESSFEINMKEIPENTVELARFISEYISKVTGSDWKKELAAVMAAYVHYFSCGRAKLKDSVRTELLLNLNHDISKVSCQIASIILDHVGASSLDTLFEDELTAVALLIGAYEEILICESGSSSFKSCSHDLEVQHDEILKDAFNYIKDTIVFVNPHKLVPLVQNAVRNMEQKSFKCFSLSIKIRLVIHISFSVERLLQRNEVPHKDANIYKTLYKDEISQIKNSLNEIGETFNVEYSIHELSYVYDILQ